MKRSLLNPLLLGSIILWLFAPAWREGRTLWVRDNLVNFLPNHAYWIERVRSGELPHWNPYVAGGMPFAADPVQGTFYPPRLLALLVQDPVLSFNLLIGLHLFILGWGFERFLRKFGTGRIAALAGGLTVMLSGTFLNSTYLVEFLYAQAWTGWLLCAALDFARGRASQAASGRPGFWIAFFGGLMLLAGEPQTFIVNWGVLLLFWLFVPIGAETVFTRRAGRAILGCTLFGALAIGIGIVQWFPARYLIEETARGALGFGLKDAEGCGFHPARWFELIVPGFFGDDAGDLTLWSPKIACIGHSTLYISTIYVGLLAVLLAIFGIVEGRPRRIILWTGVLTILAGLLATGPQSPLDIYSVLYRVLPGWNRFRNTERLLPWMTMGLGLLAGFGLDRLRTKTNQIHLFILSAACLACWTVFAIIDWPGISKAFDPHSYLYLKDVVSRSVQAGSVSAIMAAGLFGAAFVFRSRKILFLVPLLIAVDLIGYAPELLEFWPEPGFPRTESNVMTAIRQAAGKDGFPYPPRFTGPSITLVPLTRTSIVNLREATRIRWLLADPDFNIFYHLASSETMNSFVTRRAADARQYLQPDRFESLWGNSVLLLPKGTAVPDPAYELREDFGLVGLAWNRGNRSRVVCPGKWTRLPDDGSVLRYWKERGLTVDFADETTGPFPASGKAEPASRCIVTSWAPEKYEIEVDLSADSPVVLRESFAKGWTASLADENNRTLAVYPANHVQQAVFPGPGKHRIRFEYRTPGLGIGIAGTAISLLLAIWTGRRFGYESGPLDPARSH